MAGQLVCTQCERGRKELLKRHEVVRSVFGKGPRLLGGVEWETPDDLCRAQKWVRPEPVFWPRGRVP